MNTRRLLHILSAEHGQTLSEYSILVGLIAVVVVVAFLPGVAAPISAFFASAGRLVVGG
jgi:Flp pilus assembly pilin Flp